MRVFNFLFSIALSFSLLSSSAMAPSPKSTTVKANSGLGELISESSKPVVIKFYAPWCSTCKEYDKAYQANKSKFSKQVDFYEINTDDKKFRTIVNELQVARIPITVFISADRKTVSKKLGAINQDKLGALIKSELL
ncbi:MAG: thioredoxin family protein [Candidatus Caenarcaniphilales bacterium]|nr:thioredoxin family protein [Candidatus Caenarcaniphilales bacterium]